MWAWQLSKALYTSEIKGYERFVSMQNKYNLIYREEEREMNPLCMDQNIGIIPWSPTAVGVLSGRYLKEQKLVVSQGDISRLQPDKGYDKDYFVYPENTEIVGRVVEVAKNKGVKPTQIALSWLIHKSVTAPIIGTINPEHVQEAVDAMEISLSEQEVKYLEEPYKPKPISGHK
jgi:aryl-alcohol dehydrogenase (NADP+)